MSSENQESDVRAVCQRVWAAWNERSSAAFAGAFADDGVVIGFDGSMMQGRAEVDEQLGRIFADHQTGRYVGKIKAVRFLSPTVALVRAITGIVPHGQTDINPAVNAQQVFVVLKGAEGWRIVSCQNTPAQFHGRPELSQQLTDELRQLL